MAITYVTLEQAIALHEKTLEISGGGVLGQLNVDQLNSVLDHIQNDEYYPTLGEKLTHLFHSACKFHCFTDGNKRIAIVLCAQMLLLNGYLYCTGHFIRFMENISYHVAAGRIDKELLHEIMTAFLNRDEDNEVLKLKVLHAIAGPDGAADDGIQSGGVCRTGAERERNL